METYLLGFFMVKEEVDADSQRKSTGRQQFPDDDVMAAATPNKAVQVEGTSINFTSTLVLWNFLPLLLCCSRPQQVLFQFLILLFDYLQILWINQNSTFFFFYFVQLFVA